MTKKLFSLIHGKELRLSPGTKVIPAGSVESLLDVQETMEKVSSDVEAYRQEIQEKGKQALQEAKDRGFSEGLGRWTEQLALLEGKIAMLEEEYRRLILPVAMKAAKKIVGREIELSEDTLADIVAETLRSVSQHQNITIYVDQTSLDLMERNRPKLKGVFERLESLTVQTRDDIKPGGCIIETEAGIINAEIENQWEQLQLAMEQVMTQEDRGETV